MKTAEQVLQTVTSNWMRELTDERAIQAMKEYARQVAEKALADAAENALLVTKNECNHVPVERHKTIDAMFYGRVSPCKDSILNTEIILP